MEVTLNRNRTGLQKEDTATIGELIVNENLKVVTLENDLLKISGVRPDFSPSAKMKLHQMEIDYGKFQRIAKISLPIDTDNIGAKYKEGFLQITLPKKKQKPPVIIDTSSKE